MMKNDKGEVLICTECGNLELSFLMEDGSVMNAICFHCKAVDSVQFVPEAVIVAAIVESAPEGDA